MDPNEIIRNVFNWIAIPIVGVVVVVALIAGKVKWVGVAVLALVAGAAFVYMPAGTIQAIGTSAAAGLNTFLNK